jgi:hypothetical protein
MVGTPNHQYNTPAEGTTNWHIPLNENFENLDLDVEIRDAEANKEDYDPKQGAKFEATDSGAVYYGNGTSWVLADRKVKSLVADEVASKSMSADVVVYQDSGRYKAVNQIGRVASGSDAGSVVQSAVDDAGVGGTIKIGPGTFNCDSSVTLHESQWLSGTGMYQTVFKATTNLSRQLIDGQDDGDNSEVDRIRISEMTIDMDNQGSAAIQIAVAQSCIVERVNAVNAGGRVFEDTSGGIMIRSNQTDENNTDTWILNCRTENCSHVSIDAGAGGLEGARTIITGNRCLNPNSTGGFTHGISVEKVDNSVVANNAFIENDGKGGRWSPALNINGSSNTTVVGNTVENVRRGLNIANGPAVNTVVANNTFLNYTNAGIVLQEFTNPDTKNILIIGNTFEGTGDAGNDESAVYMNKRAHANIVNNVFSNHGGTVLNLSGTAGKPFAVDNNYFADGNTGALVSMYNSDEAGDDHWMSFCGNVTEPTTTRGSGPINLNAARGICCNNVISHVDEDGFNDTLVFADTGNASGRGKWLVANNYVREISNQYAIVCPEAGLVVNNIVEGGPIGVPASASTTVRDNACFGSQQGININPGNRDDEYDVQYPIDGPRAATYTGDGTQNRVIQCAVTPEYVVVEGPDGTKYDIHAQFGTGYHHTDPAGGLSISEGGFVVGDQTTGAEPNISGESYTFYVR